MKDKLAATLLNHWYCVNRSLEIKRLKKVPSIKATYKLLDDLDCDDESAASKTIASFAEYNNKSFHSNIAHLINNDEVMASLDVKCEALKTRGNIKIIASIPGNISHEIEALVKSMRGPSQDAALSVILESIPRFDRSTDIATFVINIPCGIKEFFGNMMNIEQGFITSWNAIKTVLSAHKHVFGLLKDNESKEILGGRAHLNFKDPRVEDNIFKADRFEVVETEEARGAREIRDRLMIALARRTKKVRTVGLSNGAVEYIFEEENLEPFRVTLDVITHW